MRWSSVPISHLFQDGYLWEFLETFITKIVWRTPAFLFYYDRFLILRYDFDTPAAITRRLKSIQTRTAGIADVSKLNHFLYRGERYSNRFSKGDIAVVAELNDIIVGMEWIEVGKTHYEEEDEYHFPLPEGAFWTYDGYVPQPYQVKGVWASITDEVIRVQRQNNFHSVYCMVKGLNRHALNSHLRYGYQKRRQVLFVRLLFLRIYIERKMDPEATDDGWRATFAFRRLRFYKGCLRT